MKGKARRLLSWVCVLALCMSLLPVTALAVPGDGNTSSLTPADRYYTLNGNDTTKEQADITLSKTAVDKGDGTYEVTLSATADQVVTAKPTEVVFVIDGSGSMSWCTQEPQGKHHKHTSVYSCSVANDDWSKSRWSIALNAVEDMMENLGEEGISYKFVVFSDRANVYENFDSIRFPTGGTNLSNGIEKALDEFHNDRDTNKVMIVVADGDSNDGYSPDGLWSFKNWQDGEVYTVGFTFSSDEFNNLSNGPGYYFTANDAGQLKLSMEQISENIKGLISDPLGQNVELVGDVKVDVSGDQTAEGWCWVTNERTINWTCAEGLNGTVTLTYTVKVKDDAIQAGSNTIPLNGEATLNYSTSQTGYQEVLFPKPVATFEAATLDVDYQFNGNTIQENNEWVAVTDGAAFNTEIPAVGEQVNVNRTNYWVTEVQGKVDNPLEAKAYKVQVILSKEQPALSDSIYIEVYLDGDKVEATNAQTFGQYITNVTAVGTTEGGHVSYDATNHRIQLSYQYDIINAADVQFTVTDNYVLQGIEGIFVKGENSWRGITPDGSTWTADNVQGKSTLNVYLNTEYTVEYYVNGKVSPDITDKTVYITTEGIETAQTPNFDGVTDGNDGQQGSWKNEDLKTSITVQGLPENTAEAVYSGWWLNDPTYGSETTYTEDASVSVTNAIPEDGTQVIKFYAQSSIPTANYTVNYEFLDKDGNKIPNTDSWTSGDSFPQGGTATIGETVNLEQTDPALPETVTRDDGNNYVLVEGNYSCEITAEGPNNITVTYALDNWDDGNDTETGGDGTPDYRQALIKYVVADGQENYGSVTPGTQVETLTESEGTYTGSVTASSKATANDGYAFDYWTSPKSETSWNATLSDTFTAQGGQTYTYTANFAKDTNKDDIPDKYQVFVNFVSADEDRGEVSTKDDAKDNTGINQVYTLKDEDGHYVTTGDVTPSLDGVVVEANEGFAFDIWTKDDGTDKVSPEALLKAVEGGTTITFYARFTAVENVTVNKELVKVNNENYDGTSKVNSGDVLTYQITVQNTGGADATNGGNPFVLADTMWKDGAPDNYQVTFTDANGNSQDLTGIYTIEGDSVKIGAIPARSQYVFTYTYTVQQSDEGKTLENTATLAYNAEETIEDTVKVDVEKTHCIITYEYQSGSDGMQLPTEAEGFPPVPASQTLEIGGTVQLPTPETIQVRVEGGVWIFLGWYTDEGLLNPPIIARDDMTIIGLWVFNEAYTLTYDANGGDNGSVPTDSTAYTEGQTATLNTENKPTHAQAPTPEGSVITDEELVDVVFIGWSTTQTDKIFAAGEDYGDIVTQVTFQDQDITVYAVWGYDENGDGIADAQQIVITPADITIYTGGDSYGGIVKDDGSIEQNNGMPEPGFYFILPYELDNELGGRGNTEDLTGKLRLHYENGDDIRTWDLALYNEEAGTANKVYGKYYIYRLKPVNNNDLVVRVEIQDGDRLVTSDQFDISLNGELYKEYTMTLYTNSVEQNRVTAQTNVDGTGTDWTPRDTQGIALGTGTLTIRGTNDEEPVSEILDNVTAPVEEITAKAAEGTKYTINDSNLPVVNQDAVQLLNDSLVEGSTDALKEAIVDEATTDDSVTITEDYQFDFCYLDLVDTSNGNAYATTNQPLEIYWPYPDGTNQDTTFYIAHFDGLDREFDPNNLENELNGAELKIYSANTDNSDLKLENTEQGIKISTSTFSPFVLVYNQKDAAAPSLTVDKELTAVNEKAPGSSVSVGDTLTYTIKVTNNGNVDLTNVTVTDTMSNGRTVTWVNLPDGVTNENGTLTITSLAAGTSVELTATYKVLRADASSNLVNTAKVTGTNPGDPGNPVTDEVQTPGTPVNPYRPPIRPPEDPDKPELNTEDHYAYIVGYEDGSVQPEGDITRAEVATIFFRLLTDESRNEYWSQTNPYSDVSADDWFNNAVSTLTNAGVLDGYEDGTFKPNGNITRAEFATITARFFEATYDGENLFPDIEGHWAQDYINEAANAGIVNGYEDGTFRPQQYITRAEAVTMVNRTIERHPDADHLLDDMIVWPDNPETAWYYEQIQEATNSHEYTMNTDDEQNPYEIWTKLLPNRDWSELEKEWSDANDGAGSGEVV